MRGAGFMALRPFVVGIAGGSGAGKTRLALALQEHFGYSRCHILSQDSYYVDHLQDFIEDGGAVNFDHPDAIDFALMTRQLAQLKNGEAVDVPTYDFSRHHRLPQTQHVESRPLLIVEGILILSAAPLRALFDESVFLEVPEALRFSRRLQRDTRERGRKEDGVRKQFQNHVKPMHDAYVEPTSRYATRVLKDDAEINAYVQDIEQRLQF